MDYDLLSQFDHTNADPIAQAQAAALLSQQSQIQPPSFQGGAGIAQGRPETITYDFNTQTVAPYVNPTNYVAAGGNNQIAQDAFAAARALQDQGRQEWAQNRPGIYEDSGDWNTTPTRQSNVAPRMNPNMQATQASGVAQRAGLPPELFQLWQDYQPTAGNGALAYEAGGNVYLPPSLPTNQSMNNYIPVHENLHVFEEFLTPDERAHLNFLMQAYPQPAGIPAQHHPSGTSEGVATGLTAYYDNWLGPWSTPGMTGQRPPAPPPAITEWLRMMAPIVRQRAQSGTIPNSLQPPRQ